MFRYVLCRSNIKYYMRVYVLYLFYLQHAVPKLYSNSIKKKYFLGICIEIVVPTSKVTICSFAKLYFPQSKVTTLVILGLLYGAVYRVLGALSKIHICHGMERTFSNFSTILHIMLCSYDIWVRVTNKINGGPREVRVPCAQSVIWPWILQGLYSWLD
jgi:hypothetical protein